MNVASGALPTPGVTASFVVSSLVKLSSLGDRGVSPYDDQRLFSCGTLMQHPSIWGVFGACHARRLNRHSVLRLLIPHTAYGTLIATPPRHPEELACKGKV